MAPARLMIVNASFRNVRGLSLLMALEDAVEVVGWATGRDDAVQRFEEVRPDAVLIEHPLGEEDGIELASRLTSLEEGACVIITSASTEALERARLAGVSGWLAHDLPPDVLLDQVRRITMQTLGGG